MEVKPGYKETAVGVIPQEWDVKSFGKVFAFCNGVNADKNSYGKGFRFVNVLEPITYSHIHGPEIPGRVAIPDSVAGAYAVRRGDVLFNRTSETDSELGLAATYLGTEHVVFGGFVIRGRPRDDTFDPTYSGYALRAPIIRSQIIPMGQGAIRANIGQRSLGRVLAPVPPKREQRAIAAALSDMDALLGWLDRLIAKKRDLKQAAMQQLLTGNTRLPGFHGEWEVKALKHFVTRDRFAIVDGPFGSQMKVDEFVESGVPVIEMEHLSDDFITERIVRCITPRKFEDLKRSAVYPGDIIISKTGSLGKLGLLPDGVERGLITSRLAKITLDPSHADRRFVFQYLLKLRNDGYWERVSQGGTMQILGIGMLQNAPIPDITVPEQAAIAAVLSDMDAELTALVPRRDKTRDLKQAMMQELLTGKTRLVPAGAAHA